MPTMSIAFDSARWEKVKRDYTRWWAGELERPLIFVTLDGRDPGRPEPELPLRGFMTAHDQSVPVEQIVDRWDHHLSSFEYLGDAFPSIWPNLGPGVLSVFLGAELKPGIETTWFHPREDREIGDIRFRYRPDDVWMPRLKEFYALASAKWQGLVHLGMTDLGGNLDILSTFRPSEKLLLDLYDYPEEVKRLTWEAHEAWFRCFADLDAVFRQNNPGYTAWTPIFSTEPSYMLQCDFSYMIGPDMFDEFVRPELVAACKRLVNPFYHLDGPGQLPHLDSLLSIPELKGIQWVPGAGAPDCGQWPEVYRKIHDAGKLIQVFGGAPCPEFDAIVEQIGTAEGIILTAGASADRKDEVLEFLAKYGVA